MSQKFLFAVAALALAAAVPVFRTSAHPASPALTRSDEPGGTDADARLARDNPDEYAWQLFFFMSRQASNNAAGVPDPQEATFRDDQPGAAVVWEGWALASGDRESEVFKCNPVQWTELTNRQAIPGDALSPNLTELVDNKLTKPAGNKPPPGQEGGFIGPRGLIQNEAEVRYNRETYETIQEQFWNREAINSKVQEEQDSQTPEFVDFQAGSKATKAVWIVLCNGGTSCADVQRYHWREVTDNTGSHIWGLAALHIMTKEKNMPDWFWADFIHEDCLENKAPCTLANPQAPRDASDSTTAASHGIRPETIGTPWANYRLMGTETDFQTAGHDNALSDPVIEHETQPSSCITCHDYASTAPIAPALVPMDNLPVLSLDTLKVLGRPDESVLSQPPANGGTASQKPARKYIQSDFLWSMIMLVKSKQQVCQ